MSKAMPKRTSKASSHFDALFGARQGEQLAGGLKLIPRDKIERGSQPRQSFPAEEISELAASLTQLRQRGEGIEGTGFLQPLLVTQQGDSYRLIAGERRHRASEQAGIDQLPAIVVALGPSSVLLAQLIENLQRRDLPPLEEARGMSQLMSEQGLSLREAARVLGKGKGYVENRLNLLKMGADVQEMVSVQTDTLLHARDIDGVPDPEHRRALIRAVLQDGLSRAELRQRIQPQLETPKTPGRATPEGQALEQVLEAEASHRMPAEEMSFSEDDGLLSVRTDTQPPIAANKSAAGPSPSDTQLPVKQLPVKPAPPSVLSQLRPAAALTVQASRIMQEGAALSQPEEREVRKQLRVLEEQIRHIREQLTAAESGGAK